MVCVLFPWCLQQWFCTSLPRDPSTPNPLASLKRLAYWSVSHSKRSKRCGLSVKWAANRPLAVVYVVLCTVFIGKLRICHKKETVSWKHFIVIRDTNDTLFLPLANEVCEGYVFTRVCQSFCSRAGRVWLQGGCDCWGACVVVGGGMCGCQGHEWLWGACVVVGEHAWLRGVCMVAGGCVVGACVVVGGMRGCQGACMVAEGGMHGWRGVCMVAGGGMHGIWRDTVNELAVLILLECILVMDHLFKLHSKLFLQLSQLCYISAIYISFIHYDLSFKHFHCDFCIKNGINVKLKCLRWCLSTFLIM